MKKMAKNSIVYPTLKISQKTRPKSDVFLAIWLNPKCVTFWSDSVLLWSDSSTITVKLKF